jgi:hypothetical protein
MDLLRLVPGILGWPWTDREPAVDALFQDMDRTKRLRRRWVSGLYRIPDTGLLGLTRLRTHILICGFPAAGTTLLQLMLENGLPRARRFGREVGGWRAATYTWRNHEVVISKVPHDLFRLEPLRRFYATRQAGLRVILMQRDPRDLLTASRTVGGREIYCGRTCLWQKYYDAFLRHRSDPDTLVVRYEDLVADACGQQSRIESFVGQTMAVPFRSFDAVERRDFDTTTLCGLRPVEATRVARWTRPEHADRLRHVLSQAPDLAEAVVELGYETNTDWVRRIVAG